MSFARIQLITQPKDRPAFRTTNGAAETFIAELLDDDGAPVDLTRYAVADTTPVSAGLRSLPITAGIWFAVVSYIGQVPKTVSKQATVHGDDPTAGLVEISLTPADILLPGLYLAEVDLIADGVLEQAYHFYLESQASTLWTAHAPLSIAEIRLWARDNDPETNDLLDEVEYKDAEIAAALRRGVDLWNSTPPMMSRHTYSMTTFPPAFRSQLIDVTIGFLKNMAADWYDRNHLEYNAGGLSVNDRAKGNLYRQDAMLRLKNFQDWMRNVKIQLNANAAWGRVGYLRLP